MKLSFILAIAIAEIVNGLPIPQNAQVELERRKGGGGKFSSGKGKRKDMLTQRINETANQAPVCPKMAEGLDQNQAA